jgi:hypothetical protein
MWQVANARMKGMMTCPISETTAACRAGSFTGKLGWSMRVDVF